jgi:copper transport protein
MPHRRIAVRFGATAVVVAAMVFVTPPAARGHAELVSSDPGYGDRLVTAPLEVRLVFSGVVDLTGARITFQRRGGPVEVLRPIHASADRRVVSNPLPPALDDGAYTMVWTFLGSDGHVMAGEVPFQVGAEESATATAASPVTAARPAPRPTIEVQPVGPATAPDPARRAAPAPAAKPARFTMAVVIPHTVVRFLNYASLVVLVGGGVFLVRVWADGASERRARQLLWWALLGSAGTTLLSVGLTAAGLRGVGALDALDPSVLGAVLGTRYSRVMTARAVFLALIFLALVLLTVGRDRAVRSRWWRLLAGAGGSGVVVTYALLGHVSNEGWAARLAVFVHVSGVAVWLGGLVFLAGLVLPRRYAEEVRVLLPRFSRLAFTAVSAMVVAGAVMLVRVVPELSDLPRTGYGRVVLLKLAMVALLLAAAQRARAFTEGRLVKDSTRMRPLLAAVGVELALAVMILSSTSVLVGRVPPGERTRAVATSPVVPTNEVSTLKGG